jgi:hypothetical protein
MLMKSFHLDAKPFPKEYLFREKRWTFKTSQR